MSGQSMIEVWLLVNLRTHRCKRRLALKKNSKMTRSRNNAGMKQRSVGRLGIDLGDQTSHPCVLDEQGEVILQGTVPTTEAVSVSNSGI